MGHTIKNQYYVSVRPKHWHIRCECQKVVSLHRTYGRNDISEMSRTEGLSTEKG